MVSRDILPLKFFPKGSNEPVDYLSGRNEEAFLKYLTTNAGLHRVAGGLLDTEAGRIADLDKVIEQGLDKVISEAKAFSSSASEKYAKYYARVAEKLQSKASYVQDEVVRLEGILAKGNLAPEKLDDFYIRKNILNAFNGLKKAVHEDL